jgi:hypothetical protein
MARKSIHGRLAAHRNSKRKGRIWTHFSAIEVGRKITDVEIAELEGLLRHIYRKDSKANRLNIAKRFAKLRPVRQNDLSKWL